MKSLLFLFCPIITGFMAVSHAASLDGTLYARFICRSKANGYKALVPGSCSQYFECQMSRSEMHFCPRFFDAKNGVCVVTNPGCDEPLKASKHIPAGCIGPCCGISSGYVLDPIISQTYYICKNNYVAEEQTCEGNEVFNLVKRCCDKPSNCGSIPTPEPPCTARPTTTCAPGHHTTSSTPCSRTPSTYTKPAKITESSSRSTTCLPHYSSTQTTTSPGSSSSTQRISTRSSSFPSDYTTITIPKPSSTTRTPLSSSTVSVMTTTGKPHDTSTSFVSTKSSPITSSGSTTETVSITTPSSQPKTTTKKPTITSTSTARSTQSSTMSSPESTTRGVTSWRIQETSSSSPLSSSTAKTTTVRDPTGTTTCTSSTIASTKCSRPTTTPCGIITRTTTKCATTTRPCDIPTPCPITNNKIISAIRPQPVNSESSMSYYLNYVCRDKHDGFLLASLKSCNNYYVCRDGIALPLTCGRKYFNSLKGICDLPENTNCHLDSA